MSIKCIGVRPGIFKDKVRFRATKDYEATFETLMGDKTFYVSKGDEFVLKLPKDDMWEKGDEARNFECLITNFNQHKFNWYWDD